MSGAGELAVGDVVTVDVGPVAHGGHCVARHEGRVLFVRHAIPGERVVARVTEGGAGDRFLRADAVEILTPSPHRVPPPCPYAGPGRCGGCDFQHVSLGHQRELKAAVVREQFDRLARLDLDAAGLGPVVEPVSGDRDGLGWRTRVEFAVGADARPGLRAHRSHDVIAVDRCAIAVDAVNDSGVLQRSWQPPVEAVDVVASAGAEAVVVPVPGDAAVPEVVEHVSTTGGWTADLAVSARGFWQVHPGAAATFVDTVLGMLEPARGERALDLYAGVGLFAAALADAVGSAGQVVAVESDPQAVRSARTNLAGRPHAVVVGARVDDALGTPRPSRRGPRRGGSRPRKAVRSPLLPERADLVVLDPPRTGAGRQVVVALAALRPRAMAYVACDPAALARDTAYLGDAGYRLSALRALDAFPMTHHLECVALFTPAG